MTKPICSLLMLSLLVLGPALAGGATYRLNRGVTVFVNNPQGQAFTVRLDVRDINLYEAGHPGFKHQLLTTYLEHILPHMKNFQAGDLTQCQTCGEPTSQDLCKVCELRQKLGLKLP